MHKRQKALSTELPPGIRLGRRLSCGFHFHNFIQIFFKVSGHVRKGKVAQHSEPCLWPF